MVNDKLVQQLQPREVFYFFAKISEIPRESGHEQAIADYLENFAKERNLLCLRDVNNNILIKKAGTKGKEHLPPLIIQGHTDMVCVAKPGHAHDFRRDPIVWRLEGDRLFASDTTLGADNGIAVAYALALLDAQNLTHPPLEVLLTTEEETGMHGAAALNPDWFKGRTLLNLDSEEEGIFLASCAGGTTLEVCHPLQTEPCDKSGLHLHLHSFKSGHSGMEIVQQRANAIQVAGRLLAAASALPGFQIFAFQGGSKHNAIAAEAEVWVTTEDLAELKACCERTFAEIRQEYATTDPDIELTITEQLSEKVWASSTSKQIAQFYFLVAHGVDEMDPDLPGLVRTSLNLGVLRFTEAELNCIISIRSSLASRKDYLAQKIDLMAALTSGAAKVQSAYPAWEYALHSPFRDLALRVYAASTGQEAEISAIHAGLECGLLSAKIPHCDMLSMGPNTYDVHTYMESISVSSVANVWEFLQKLLAEYEIA